MLVKYKKWGLGLALTVTMLALLLAAGCGPSDGKCRDAERTLMTTDSESKAMEALEYLEENCTVDDDGNTVAK